MFKRFFDWLENWNNNRRMHQIARFWAKQGSLTPYAEAAHEMALRMRLEEFRNFASRRYLEDPKLTRNQIKDEWIESTIKPMLKSEFCREDGKMLAGAINAMGDEMFHTRARAARELELELAFEESVALSPGIQRTQREQAMRINNG